MFSQPLICILLGAGIAGAVTALKGLPFVRNNPTIVAGAISLLLSVVSQLHLSGGGVFSFLNVGDLLTCFLTQLMAAVGTHEMVIKPAAQALVNRNPPAATVTHLEVPLVTSPAVIVPVSPTTPQTILK